MSCKRRSFYLLLAVIIGTLCVVMPLVVSRASSPQIAASGRAVSAAAFEKRESAYRANNLGVALLEQFKYKDGADAFRRALEIDPTLALAKINLGIALYNVPELDDALREAKAAAAQTPDAPQPFYVLGLIAKSQNRPDEALAAFTRVIQIDPHDTGANINLGQLYVQQRKYPEAMAAFRVALTAEPYNATATYNLATALLRSGNREEGQQMMGRFQKLREGGYGSSIGQNYLEQGRYAEAIASTGAEPALVDARPPDVSFTDATANMLPVTNAAAGSSDKPRSNEAQKKDFAKNLGGVVTLFDYDGDGKLDLFAANKSTLNLYHNENGKFLDVTQRADLTNYAANSVCVAAVAGDYDNDEKPDLLVMTYPGGVHLYHNDGDGKFSDRTNAAEIPAYSYLSLSVAFVDADHDGDLDIFIAGSADPTKAANNAKTSRKFPDDFSGAPNMLLRNNGNGKFTDVTATANLAAMPAKAVAVIPSDYDNRRDVDLLIANYAAAPALYSNLRDGTFRDVASDVGLKFNDHIAALAAGDINKDGYTDFFFGKTDGPGIFAMSDGHDHFVLSAAPAETNGASAAQLLDYDNDGLLDLVFFTDGNLHVLRNLGAKWDDVSARVNRGASINKVSKTTGAVSASPRAFASGDIDGDGDTDIIVSRPDGGLKIFLNEGGNRNNSVHVQLAGKVSNRSGIGAKVEARAGSLKQRTETYAASPAPAPADVNFGLGTRAAVDAVRVLWPAGIVQAETEIATNAKTETAEHSATGAKQNINITEIDRKPSSCPYLYTWNGERFEFVTDFMGGGEMGYWEAPGRWNHPDPDEYVRIRDDQLKERDGRYELRVTNELEEVLYVDRLQLLAVAHPADTEIYPNEGMVDPPRPFKLFTMHGAHAPLTAIDERGRDVLPRLAKLDRQFVDDFELKKIRGYAAEHTLTLKLDKDGAQTARPLLLLTGWTDYAFSSDNVAARQAGLEGRPPALQVKDARGRWRTVIEDIGIPIGRPQTMVIDLTGKFLSASREVRLVTNMRIYWDQILYDASNARDETVITRLDATTADLNWRGFSAESSPDGRAPYGYDYARVSFVSPWKAVPGRYTREGDVRELLSASDDMFVISRPGDQITLSFDAAKLPPLPQGWKRTFLFYGDGYSKEMDINSASPDRVAPLPFHGMKRYPYAAPEAYPMTQARSEYLKRYNTRLVGDALPSLDATGINLAGAAKDAHALSPSTTEAKRK